MISKRNTIKEAIYKTLLLLIAIITSIYLWGLGFYNTLAADDFGFAADVKNQGLFSLMTNNYLHWQGRWSGFLVSGVIFKIFGYSKQLLLHTILLCIAGYIPAALFIRKRMKQGYFDTIIISISLVNVTLMSILEFSTIYWLCTAGYILVVWATVLLFYLIKYGTPGGTFFSTIVGLICCIYISGSAENYTPLIIALLLIYLIYNFRTLGSTKNKELILYLFVLIAGCLIMMLAPGNKNRLNGFETSYLSEFKLIPFAKATIKATTILGLRLLSKFFYYLVILFTAIAIGYHVKDNNVIFEYSIKQNIIDLAFLIVFIICSVGGCVFGFGWYAPLRAMGFLSFAICGFTFIWGVKLGYILHSSVLPSVFCGCATASICIATAFYIHNDFPKAKLYNKEKTELLTTIYEENKKGRTEPLYIQSYHIEKVQSSYSRLRNFLDKSLVKEPSHYEEYFPYFVDGYSIDPNDWRNKGLQEYTGAQFEIIGWEE